MNLRIFVETHENPNYVDSVEVGIDDSTLDQYWHNIEENGLVSFDRQYLSSQLHLLLLYVKNISYLIT